VPIESSPAHRRSVLWPDTLKVICQAFDEAWLTIAGNFGSGTIEAGRLRLANALLSVAHEDSRDVGALKRGALEAMALSYSGVQRDQISN
jgi:hypothetical protein